MAEGPVQSVLRQVRKLVGSQDAQGLADGELLNRFTTHRDEAAFEVLMWRHGPMVLALCRRVLKNRHDAEDAFQATFLTLARKAASIAKHHSLGGWLSRVAYRIALRVKTSAKGSLPRRDGLNQLHASEGADQIGREDLRVLLDQEIERLPEKYRLPIVLCYFQGKTNQEAAQQLRCPVGTVFTRLHRARRLLRGRLSRRGLALSASTLAAALTQSRASAALPPTLVPAGVSAAARFAAGNSTAPGIVSPHAITLAEGALRAMKMTKVKLMTALLAVLALGVTVGGLVYAAIADDTATPEQPRPSSVQAEKKPQESPKPGVARVEDSRRLTSWREGPTFKGLAHPPYTIAFSNDGTGVAAADHQGFAKVWDVAKEKEHASFKWKTPAEVPAPKVYIPPVYTHAFSPDLKTLALGYEDGSIKLWNLTTGKVQITLQGHKSIVNWLSFCPDGKQMVSASYDDTIRLWDLAKEKELAAYQTKHEPLELAMSRDGKTLAAHLVPHRGRGNPNFADAYVTLLDGTTLKPRGPAFPVGAHAFTLSFALSPDGAVLATASMRHVVTLWDTKTGKELRKLPPGSYVAFAPDGKTLAVGLVEVKPKEGDWRHRAVALYDTATGEQTAFLGHVDELGRMAFAPDSKTLLRATGLGRNPAVNYAPGKEPTYWGGVQLWLAEPPSPGEQK